MRDKTAFKVLRRKQVRGFSFPLALYVRLIYMCRSNADLPATALDSEIVETVVL